MNTTMKTNNDFSAHLIWRLGDANGSAGVSPASVAGLTPAFRRAAMMLLTTMPA